MFIFHISFVRHFLKPEILISYYFNFVITWFMILFHFFFYFSSFHGLLVTGDEDVATLEGGTWSSGSGHSPTLT